MTTTELARWTLGTVAAVLLAGPMTAAAAKIRLDTR